MGLLNDVATAIWTSWQRVQGRSTFQQIDPGASSTRIIYVPRVEAGVRVNEDNALTYSAVFACTRIIAETLGTLGWHVFRRLPNGGKERVPGHVEFLLRDQPNPETMAIGWREQMVASALLWGGGFAEIVRDGAGRVVELWQIAPDRVQIDRVQRDGRLIYEVSNRTESNAFLEQNQIFHLHGLGFDGISGYSVVRLAARSIGTGMAADKFAGSFYANGTWVGGVLKRPAGVPPLSEAGQKNLRESWTRMFQGADKAFHPAILEEGTEWESLGMPLQDAEFVATRKFQVTDIARWFRVPPHKLADLERATFSNIEHQSLEFVQDTILPWAIRLEQEANSKLFGQNRQGFFTKLNLNSLLRGDVESRYRAYTAGRQWGWLSANDIREMEDMNPIGTQGDVYLSPMNMVNAKTFVGMREEAPPTNGQRQITIEETEDEEEPMAVLRAAHRDLIAGAIERVVKREEKWAESAKRKYDGAELGKTITGFLASDGHQSYFSEALMPPMLAFARILFTGNITEQIEHTLRNLLALEFCMRLAQRQAQLLGGEQPDITMQADSLIERVLAMRLTITAAS